ncbi:MAG: DUF1788 domain-containing protein [Anaerolineales bacterium]|nr:DUF1788 domain-containing protein [Anaerolineales bacterium]
MTRIEELLQAYDDLLGQPWPEHLSGGEKVWFAVYEPAQERRLLLRLPDFETATLKAGHGWQQLDLAPLFAEWMGAHRYREAYFSDPEALGSALPVFCTSVADRVRALLKEPQSDETTVVALTGAGTLYGLIRVSEVLEQVIGDIRGRLLVFFPGHYEKAQYRLLKAHPDWNYLAVPIVARNGEPKP